MPEPTRNVPPEGPGHPPRPRYVTHGRNGHGEPAAMGWRPGGPLPPPALSSGPDASTLLKALKRRWAVALVLGLLVAGSVGVGAWFLLTPKYTVFSQLHVSSRRERMLPTPVQESRNEFPAYVRAQAERLRSRYVIGAALKQEGVKRLAMISQLPQPIPWIEQELKVDFKDGSEFITVSMRGENEAALVTFINALVQAYWQEYIKAERKQQSDLIARLDKSLNEAKERLRKTQDAINTRSSQLVTTTDTQAIALKVQLLVADYSDRKRRLDDVRAQLLQRQANLETLRRREKTPAEVAISDADLERALEEDPRCKERLGAVERAERDLKEFLGRKTSVAYGLREERLKNAQKALDSLRGELRPKLVEQVRQLERTTVQAEIQKLQVELEALARMEAPLSKDVEALRTEVNNSKLEATKVTQVTGDLKQLEVEVTNDKNLVDDLTRQYERARFDLDSDPRVTIYQEAAVQYKDNKRQILAATAAGLAGLVGVAFCVSWWEFRARRIQTPEEVVTGLGMRVMGSVPLLPQYTLLSSDGELDAHSQSLQEAIDGIRTMLLRDAHMEGTRVVMVTSAVDGEGKTMLASHLAQSLARAGRRTLLVDCDLRRPAAHQLFEQTLQPGFSEVLLREVDESDAIRPTTAADGLFLFPAGQWDREVIQALAKDGLEKIFERMRDEYDFVIVDSHPVLAATDSLLIGQYVDAVILSVLRDVSQVPRVYGAYQKLTNLGIRVLGSVITGVPEEEVYGAALQYSAAPR